MTCTNAVDFVDFWWGKLIVVPLLEVSCFLLTHGISLTKTPERLPQGLDCAAGIKSPRYTVNLAGIESQW